MLRLGGRAGQTLRPQYICTSCRALLALRRPYVASRSAPLQLPASRLLRYYSDEAPARDSGAAVASSESPLASTEGSLPKKKKGSKKGNPLPSPSATQPGRRGKKKGPVRRVRAKTVPIIKVSEKGTPGRPIPDSSQAAVTTARTTRSIKEALRNLVFGAPAASALPVDVPKVKTKNVMDHNLPMFYDLQKLRRVMEKEVALERSGGKAGRKDVRGHPGKPAIAKTASPTRAMKTAAVNAAAAAATATAPTTPPPTGPANPASYGESGNAGTEPTPPTTGKKRKKKSKTKIPDIETVDASELRLTPVDKPQPPVPRLAYGLDRVLFNPGVYHLQDPRSRVYNFDPYLASIMPVREFDFGALRQYVTSSKDRTLANIAKEAGKKYSGSTSSMTSMLAHFHYLLSAWRPINPDHVSRSFPVESRQFTRIGRAPAAIFLQYQDGTYAIDADKEFDTANVLSMLGKSMEKLLTLPKEDFEKYRRINSDQLTDEERNSDESYHYTTMGDFMMRSQLDAHDPRVPGTGMFDLKTRAVVSIRMDAASYHKGVGYEIRSRFGEWESYEREYYDMIRSAFMKYSLQVRMGRMDGIFVAFHNIQRIFGFQYISLPEMDEAIHGTSNTTLGGMEFRLSLHLLNKLLDKATERFPNQSLRLHFETRPTDPPFMYVFAKPVTQDQIEEVQNKNKAAVEAFERDMMGLVRDEKEDAEEDAPLMLEEDQDAEEDEETSLDVWEDMRLKVEEALENDEQGENFVRDAIEEALEASGLLKTESIEERQQYLKALMEAIVSEDDVDAAETASEADITSGGMSIGGEGEGASETVSDIPAQTEPVENTLEDADRCNVDVQEAEQEAAGQDLVEGEPAIGDAETQEQDTASEGDEPPLKDLIMRLAAKSRTNSAAYRETQDGLEEDDSSDWQKLRRFEEILREIVEKTSTTSESSVLEDSVTSDASEQDGKPSPLDAPVTEEQPPTAQIEPLPSDVVDSIDKHEELLGMIVTLRNKVDGRFVERPERLTAKSTWEVHYAIEELQRDRASKIYLQTIERRKKMLVRKEDEPGNRFNDNFKKKLQTLSNSGRAWRRREMEKRKNYPVHVYGVDKPLRWEDVFSDEGEPHPPKLS